MFEIFVVAPLLLCFTRGAAADSCAGPVGAWEVPECLSIVVTNEIVAARGEFWAVDSSETRYTSLVDLWMAKGGEPTASLAWHNCVSSFWAAQAPNAEAVLGELATSLGLEVADMDHGRRILTQMLADRSGVFNPAQRASPRCLSVAAGIGREAAGILAPVCGSVDLVEPQQHFLTAAVAALAATGVDGRPFCSTAEDFVFDNEGYDVIWLQWGSSLISDAALVRLLQGAASALAIRASRGGHAVLVIKDNVSEFADAVYSDDSCMVVRSQAYIDALVAVAGRDGVPLRLVTKERQEPWDDAFFPAYFLVYTLASDAGAGDGVGRSVEL